MQASRDLHASRSDATEAAAIIIGAGPAGLAVGACLSRANVPFTILEREESVASSWRGHYDRLHLHTSKGTSALPYQPFPRDYPTYPSREQVVEYVESYARAFRLEPRFGEDVVSAKPHDGGWHVQTRKTTYRAPHLVVASGLNREPVVPQWPGAELYGGAKLHSSDYRSGRDYRGRRVLVVGFGNSGAEIALDLHEHGADASIVVRGGANVLPRDIFGIPIVSVAAVSGLLPPPMADAMNAPLLRILIGNLRRHGVEPLPYGPLTQIARTGRIPLIDVGTVRLIQEGRIAVRPGVERFVEDGVVFTDGKREAFDAVVFATGFRARVNRFLEVDGVCDENGNPRRGASLPERLHLCGFSVVANGLLNQISRDAKRVAAKIAAKRPRR